MPRNKVVYRNERHATIGNQDINLAIEVNGDMGAETGILLIKEIDKLFGRLRVSMTSVKLAKE